MECGPLPPDDEARWRKIRDVRRMGSSEGADCPSVRCADQRSCVGLSGVPAAREMIWSRGADCISLSHSPASPAYIPTCHNYPQVRSPPPGRAAGSRAGGGGASRFVFVLVFPMPARIVTLPALEQLAGGRLGVIFK